MPFLPWRKARCWWWLENWGDHRSICVSMTGAAGVVIDGAFRDVENCEKAGFPIFAKGLTCGTAGKTGKGAIQVPVNCGGVVVCPGDLVVGDRGSDSADSENMSSVQTIGRQLPLQPGRRAGNPWEQQV